MERHDRPASTGSISTDATRRDSTRKPSARPSNARSVTHRHRARSSSVPRARSRFGRDRAIDREVDLESLGARARSSASPLAPPSSPRYVVRAHTIHTRARGSRRERDQSGVQRQGDHDCVCVTPVVQPSRACVRAFGRGRGERHGIWVRTHQRVPLRRPDAIQSTSTPIHRRVEVLYVLIDYRICVCIVW